MPKPKKPSSPKQSENSTKLEQPDLKRMHSQVPRMKNPVEVNTEDGSETYLIRLVTEKGQEIA